MVPVKNKEYDRSVEDPAAMQNAYQLVDGDETQIARDGRLKQKRTKR